jgi:hypothetical protein
MSNDTKLEGKLHSFSIWQLYRTRFLSFESRGFLLSLAVACSMAIHHYISRVILLFYLKLQASYKNSLRSRAMFIGRRDRALAGRG